jgi:hypothetical protein
MVAVAVMFTAAAGWTLFQTNREVASPVEVENPDGSGRALVVYHPGITDFQQRVSQAFAAGLVAGGWRVELVTASREAPVEVSRYDLVAVGAPTYWWAPARPLRRYLDRLHDLEGKRVVVLITGAGATSRSQRITEESVRAHHGTIIASHAFYTMAPNREENYAWRTNRDVGVALAESVGRAIPRPRP